MILSSDGNTYKNEFEYVASKLMPSPDVPVNATIPGINNALELSEVNPDDLIAQQGDVTYGGAKKASDEYVRERLKNPSKTNFKPGGLGVDTLK